VSERYKEEHFIRWLNLFQKEAVKHLPNTSATEIIHKASLIAESLKFGMLN
jgi:hemoglobin